MLLWRMELNSATEHKRVECHLVRRDTVYRLSLRSGKTTLVSEIHRTMATAAERAEELRRQVIEGVPCGPPSA